MRRMIILFVLLVGVLALAASGFADPGGKGKGKKAGHNRFSATVVVPDTGTCQNVWATDTSTRKWTVKKNKDGTFRVARQDNGTFVTFDGKSPGGCDTTGKHGTHVNVGIKGKFRGYLRGTVSNGNYNPSATTCAAACVGDTKVFISTFFGPGGAVHVLARLRRVQVQLRVQLAGQDPEVPSLAGPRDERSRRELRRRHRQLIAPRAD